MQSERTLEQTSGHLLASGVLFRAPHERPGGRRAIATIEPPDVLEEIRNVEARGGVELAGAERRWGRSSAMRSPPVMPAMIQPGIWRAR